MQVSALLSNHKGEGLCISDLVEVAKKEMSAFEWSNDKIRNSINRLERRGKAKSHHEIRGRIMCRVPQLI